MNEPLQAFLAEHLALPLSWTGAVAVAVAVVIVLEFLNRQLFLGLQRLVVRTETKLDDLLLKQMRWPAQALVFLAAIHVLFTLRGGESETSSKAVTIVELLLIAPTSSSRRSRWPSSTTGSASGRRCWSPMSSAT